MFIMSFPGVDLNNDKKKISMKNENSTFVFHGLQYSSIFMRVFLQKVFVFGHLVYENEHFYFSKKRYFIEN